MRQAKPSTTAVLPTPASPVRIGLFWRRRVRMSTTWRISTSRPSTGSILPARAAAVRSIVNCCSAPPADDGGLRSRPRPRRLLRRWRGRRLRARRRHRREIALQGVGRDLQELAGELAGASRQRLVGEERPQDMARADAREAMLERGEQPGLAGERHDLGRQGRRPRIAGLHAVERPVEIGSEPALLDVVVAQDRGVTSPSAASNSFSSQCSISTL